MLKITSHFFIIKKPAGKIISYMNIKKLLGKKIQKIRKTRGITQEKLAELVELDTSSISHIENGKYYPSAENLEKILKVLKITPSELFMMEANAPIKDLIEEMNSAMQNNENLTRLMYKFYRSIKD